MTKKSISNLTNSKGQQVRILGTDGDDVILQEVKTGEKYVMLASLLSENIRIGEYTATELYKPLGKEVPQAQRDEINRKVLESIEKGIQLKPETIYNLYTGIGGLHNLTFSDFDSFHDYTQAKQEFEAGQFFTSPEYAKILVELLRPGSDSRIVELGCGAGAFCNFLPQTCTYVGTDIDEKALSVAKRLYPKFTFRSSDMREMTPNKYGLFDFAIGNPPFNLRLRDSESPNAGESLSQDIYLRRIEKLLAPLGVAGFIVPAKWLQDEMTHKRMASFIMDSFYMLGQFSLPKNAFKFVGVESFETKIILLQKKGEVPLSYINQPKTVAEFVNMPLVPVQDRLSWANVGLLYNFEADARTLRRRELIMSDGVKAKESADIREKLKHSNMKLLNKLVNLTEEQQKDIADMWFNMKNQEKPLNMDYKDWEKAKITEGKVFGRIKQFHYRNTHPFQKKIALVHKNGGFIVVGYDPFTFRIAKDINEGMGELTDSRTLKAPELLSEVKKNIYDGLDDRVGEYEVVIPNFNELVKRKQRIWDTVRGDPDDAVKAKNALLVDALDLGKFTFGIDPASGVDFSYHREELINTVHKPYKFLNWAPGVGKTIYAFNWLKIKWGRTLVVSNALAIRTTWMKQSPNANLNPILLTPSFLRRGGLETVKEGDLCLMTSDASPETYKFIPKGFFKNIIIDESEVQIKNPFGIRSKSVMTLRNKAKNKLLMSGTLTRNNVSEMYNQMAFVFNNSYMMTNEAETMYYLEEKRGGSWKEEDDTSKKGSLIRVVEEITENSRIVERENPNQGEPIPYKAGYRMFQRMFSPAKPSVFGVSKQGQNLYNTEAFGLLTKGVMSYRKQDREIRPQQVQIEMTEPEKKLYLSVVTEFARIVDQIFNIQTTDSRKKALSMISLQINALFKVTSAPFSFPDYEGWIHAKAQKIIEMIRERPNDKIIIGTNWITSNRFYHHLIEETFPGKKVFYIDGESVKIENRQKIADEFCAHDGGAIIVATTQSMQNSISIPNTDAIIVESLTWNYAQFQQFYSRGIRANSPKTAEVFYLATNRSLEQNLIGLIVNKHALTSFVNTGEIVDRDEILDQLGVASDYMQEIVNVVKEELADGRTIRALDWGKAKIADRA